MATRKKTPKAKAKKADPEKKTTTKKAPAKRGRPKKAVVAKKAPAKRGRPKKIKKPEVVQEVQDVVQEEAQEEVRVRDSLIVERPTQWILVQQMQFGIINEGFPVGTVFTVDWESRRMRCEGNGIIYDNIKDLEIAIKIGTVEIYVEDGSQEQYQQQQFIEAESRANKNRQISDGRRLRDEEIRNSINRSDQDVVQNIDISNTRKVKTANSTPINVTPSSEVTINKPRQANQMQVHYSDSPQDGQIVRASNKPIIRDQVNHTRTGAKPLTPVLSDKHSWDAGKSEGTIQSEINQKMGDYSIKVDEFGQQYIRGLPVIRDDSEASGPSMNAGMAISLTKDQLSERANRIAQIKAEKQSEIASNRARGGVNIVDNSVVNNPAFESMMPQEVVPGVGYDDSGITPVEHTVSAESKPAKKKNSTAGKLLRRR